jgi:multidrug efflux pump subunit AcrB
VWIGVLMLMGIVTKNAIMLVEFSIDRFAGAWIATPPSSVPAKRRGRSS